MSHLLYTFLWSIDISLIFNSLLFNQLPFIYHSCDESLFLIYPFFYRSMQNALVSLINAFIFSFRIVLKLFFHIFSVLTVNFYILSSCRYILIFKYFFQLVFCMTYFCSVSVFYINLIILLLMLPLFLA